MEIVPVQEGVKLYQTSKEEKGAVDVADTVVPDTAAAPTLKTVAFTHKSFTGPTLILTVLALPVQLEKAGATVKVPEVAEELKSMLMALVPCPVMVTPEPLKLQL